MKKLTLLILFFSLLLFTNCIYAQTGRLEVNISIDPSFGNGGKVEADPGGFGGEITGFDGGRMLPSVASGILKTATPGLFHIGMMKLDTGGHPFPGFGQNGLVNLSWSQSDYSNDMQNNALVTGWVLAGSGFLSGDMLPAVYQIKSDGTPDSSFGVKGRFAFPFSPNSTGEATNIHYLAPKYILYGLSRKKTNDEGVTGFGIMGVTLNGTLDTTFGNKGAFVIPAAVHSVKGFYGWKDGGSSIMCGISDTGNHEILLALFTIDGKPDLAFGVGGLVHTGISAGSDTVLCAPESDTNFIVILPPPDSLPTPLRMLSFNTSGKLDPTFNHGSALVTNYVTPSFRPKGLSFNNDLSLNIGGMSNVGLGQSMFVRISDTSARADSIFNGNGVVAVDMDNGADPNYFKFIKNAGKLDQLGKIKRFLAFGGSIHNGVDNFMIARLISTPAKGVEEMDPSQENFTIYPNPASVHVTINTGASQLRSIHAIDALGREVNLPVQYNSSESLASYSCDVSKLPNGIYYLVMQREKDFLTRKFIVTH